jgi:dipeptidase E
MEPLLNLLLLSSSRANNSEYLAPNLDWIRQHLNAVSSVLFIPYAGVTVSHDAYLSKVQQALSGLAIRVDGIHQFACAKTAVQEAEAIMIGGGNTFQLLNLLYKNDIIKPIQQRVTAGMPYIGWSAGANIAGASIRTTNDMPIIQPPSFTALHFLNAQLNPHYNDFVPADFHGETRDMRLAEFMVLNPQTPVIGIPEGCALHCDGENITVLGDDGAVWFLKGEKQPLAANTELTQRFNSQLSQPLINTK